MAKMKILLVCAIVLVLVASSLAQQHNKKHSNRKKIEANKPKKRVQADAPLPSKAQRTCDNGEVQ